MTDKPNYNDGEWHGWNGGECPVHPKTVVQAVRGDKDEAFVTTWDADDFQKTCWTSQGRPHSIIAFRVIKEYREPRTIWAFGAHLFETEEKAVAFRDQLVRENPNLGYAAWSITEFREVTE